MTSGDRTQEKKSTIRRASDADTQAMAALARAAYAPYVGRIGREPAPMTDDYATVIHDTQAWVADQTRRLVGMLMLRAHDDYLLLENAAVAPDAQRLGIGKLLLDLADERARQAGLGEVRL